MIKQTDSGFNLELAQQLWNSSNPFPVDFDQARRWLGFSTKGKGRRNFEKAKMLKGVDFRPFIQNDKREIGATQRQRIALTVPAFRAWAAIAGTSQSRKVQEYFLECDRRYWSSLQSNPENAIALPQTYIEALDMLLVLSREIEELRVKLDEVTHRCHD